MAEVVNLNRARKTKTRAAGKLKAVANRASHGRTQAEKALEKARQDKMLRDLDAHRIEPPPGD